MKPPRRLALAAVVLLLAGLPAAAQEPPPEPLPAPAEPIEVEDLKAPQEQGTQPAPEEEAPEEETQEAQEPAEETEAPEEAEAAAEAPRIRFSFPVPEEEGGGAVAGTAGAIDLQREELVRLSDGVEIRYRDITLRAEKVEMDLRQMTAVAEGDVVIDQASQHLTATAADIDLTDNTGTLTDCSASVSPDYFFTGAEVSKVAEDIYTVRDGVFTSCTQEVPIWSFKIGQGRVRVDGFAKVKNARLRVKDVPVLWVPYMMWPVREERTSGFLFPHIGYSSRRGAALSLAWFQTLGRSYDTTLELDLWSEGFVGFGDEFRYRPSENTEGIFLGYLIDDPDSDEVRWKVSWDHETRNLPFGMRGVVRLQEFSDFDFFRDFEREFDRNTLRFRDSRAFVSGNWGTHSLNIMTNRRETFITQDRTVTLDKLPEIEYRMRPTRLGSLPLYLQIDSSLDYLRLERSATFQGDYVRADAFPRLTLPVRTVPWLNVSLTAGERWTFYGDSLFTPTEQSMLPPENLGAFRGESLTRTVPFGNAEIVGPSFSRIYSRDSGQGGKLKHVIEPRWSYSFLGDFDDENRVPLFDEIDTLRSTNIGTFSLINRLLAKPAGEKGGSAKEILSFELAQSFSFDADQPLQRGTVTGEVGGVPVTETLTRSASPILARLRYHPGSRLSVKAQATFNTLFDEIDTTSLTATYHRRSNSLDLTWFTRTRAETGETTGNQVRLGGGATILPGRLRFQGGINYDFELGTLQQQRYVFEYTTQCCGLRFEARDFKAGTFEDRDFRIAINLKNVGTFLDFTAGSSNR